MYRIADAYPVAVMDRDPRCPDAVFNKAVSLAAILLELTALFGLPGIFTNLVSSLT